MRKHTLDAYDDVKEFMRLSIDAGKKSVSEGGVKPKVGVVIVRDGVVLGVSYRGETGDGRHAEFGLIDRLGRETVEGATIFTTLEPCSRRGPGKHPCAQHIIDAGIKEVYIGTYDPNPLIYREGWRILRDAGISLYDYPDSMREEVANDNTEFVDSFRISVGERGSAAFDYQRDGRYELRHEGFAFTTRWSIADDTSIHAYADDGNIAIARYAAEFEQIDNPGSLDWSNHSRTPKIGEIVVFRIADAYALVKVTNVFAGPERGHDRFALHFNFEIRAKKQYL